MLKKAKKKINKLSPVWSKAKAKKIHELPKEEVNLKEELDGLKADKQEREHGGANNVR